MFGLGGGEEACGPQKMNHKLLGSKTLSEKLRDDQPKARVRDESQTQSSETSDRFRPQELGKKIRTPMIRGGEVFVPVSCLVVTFHYATADLKSIQLTQ